MCVCLANPRETWHSDYHVLFCYQLHEDTSKLIPVRFSYLMIYEEWSTCSLSYLHLLLAFIASKNRQQTNPLFQCLQKNTGALRDATSCGAWDIILKDNSGYGFSQWEKVFLCNALSHWPIPYPDTWICSCDVTWRLFPLGCNFGERIIPFILWFKSKYG